MTRAQQIWSKWAIIVFASIVVASIAPPGAQALGLGEARVDSFLNQPLDVRMRLLDVSDDDLDSLTVAPASPEDFERLGLMSNALALNLEVRIDRSVSPPVVRVTSSRPVSDPVVQLLVDARWGSGRMLREYTIFLDPPTVEVEAPAPATTRSEQQRQPADEPVRTDRSPGRAAPSQPAADTETRSTRPVASSGTRKYGPVAPGATLWSIARANLPASDVTMDQMMIAVVDLNPGAFRDGNIHHLLRGAELELPDAEQVRALDASNAAAEVAAQNRAFRRRMSSELPVVSSAGRESEVSPAADSAAGDTATRASRQSASSELGDPVDHRLSLVPPGDEESGNGLDGDASEVAELRQRLARAEEELYAARQEAEEFESRVQELETLVRGNPEGIGIRDAELAGLEATLRAAREATREDADPELRSEVSGRLEEYLEQYESASRDLDTDDLAAVGQDAGGAESGDLEVGDSEAGDSEAGDADASLDAEPAGEADEAAADMVPERPVTEVQGASGLLGNPIVLVVAGVLILLAILAGLRFALGRRKRAEQPTPLRRAADLPRTGPRAESPIDAARARVEANRADLSAHMALLHTLATEGNEQQFGDALESMFEHVESGSEPEWREALELAGRIVPGHVLVKGSSDWVAEPRPTEASEPASPFDEESEVDDLMSRLDSDFDESDESDDLDWLGEDSPTDASQETAGPLLRDDDRAGSPDASATGIGESAEGGDDDGEEPDDGLLDWPDPDDGLDDGLDDDHKDNRDETPADAQTSGAESSEDDRPTPDADEDSTGADDESDQSGDDIFAQSDDDVDVKLDLAKAYLSWNSTDSARTLLEEVAREGNTDQQQQARTLLDQLADGSET